MRPLRLACLGMITASLAGCGSSHTSTATGGNHDSGAGTGGTSAAGDSGADAAPASRLSASARAELTALDVMKYSGQAVATGEETLATGVRVSFDPASGPICLRGDPYAAFYLDRSSDKTMILLDGGGACWTGLCQADATADAVIAPIGPAADDPASYFHDWNVIFAPYCDGSVFSGDNDLTETDGTARHQHGRQNLAAALDLATQHFASSKQVLLGGFSAGGYGTIMGMVAVRLLFPTADLFVMDDSGPGVQNLSNTAAIETRITEWKFDQVIPASCTECAGGRGQLTAMFSWMMKNDPTIQIFLLSYYEDPVIGLAFNGLLGPAYKALLIQETDKVQQAYPDRFKRYMVPGANHVL